LKYRNCLAIFKSLPTSLCQREEKELPTLKKGRCEKIEDWRIAYLKSLRNSLPRHGFSQFFHTFRGIKGDFMVILCTSWNLELFFHKAKFG
jgi:hypothetical protein